MTLSRSKWQIPLVFMIATLMMTIWIVFRQPEPVVNKNSVFSNLKAYKPPPKKKAYKPPPKKRYPPPISKLHPMYNEINKEYPFQAVRNERGERVNIFVVRRALLGKKEHELYEKYGDEILFIGISSFEDYPLPSPNPFSPLQNIGNKYAGYFPGFLHMMRHPERFFEPHVKVIRMSQSDFSLPTAPQRDYATPRKYDFTFSGTDQDVNNGCVGWSSFAKNWTFVVEALEVMCGEYGLSGVLVATKNKQNTRACEIPKSCEGKMIQTVFLENQRDYFDYLKQSRFAFIPQVHDASPRVTTQALAHDVPLLMNKNIMGGWKYLNDKTGEFFSDLSDFRPALEKILKGADTEDHYEPRKWVLENYGNENSGPRFRDWIVENFSDRVKLPDGTKSLIPS